MRVESPDPHRGMNRTERRYAVEVLEVERHAGHVAWWGFERIKMKLADRCWLTIDFAVVDSHDRLTLVDVKGRKGRTWYAKEDARIKLRVAAEAFPIPVFVAWPLQGAGWGEERIGGVR